MKPAKRLALLLLPQMLIVASMIVRAEWIGQTGTEVVLAVRPWDPMDLLAGRYVRTPLAIENLEESDVVLYDLPEVGSAVYVGLTEDGDFWRAASFGSQPPRGGVFLRGELVAHEGRSLRIDYGHGRYYIPEHLPDPSAARDETGERIELALVISIDASGAGVTRDLLVGGRPLLEWAAEEEPR